MEPTTIGGVLNAVDEVVYEEFYRNYLHDFVRLAHRCKHKNQEDDVREYGVSYSILIPLHLRHIFLETASYIAEGESGGLLTPNSSVAG